MPKQKFESNFSVDLTEEEQEEDENDYEFN